MPRSKTPDGKRVTICVKVSEPQAAAIDEARGEESRSAWLLRAIGLALSPLPEVIAAVVDPDPVAVIAAQKPPALVHDGAGRPVTGCPHPPGRRQKDGAYCGRCGTGGLTKPSR